MHKKLLNNIKNLISKFSQLDKIKIFGVTVLIFFVFYILKIFGYMDYTSKYDIQDVFCYDTFVDWTLTLDNNMKTTWGLPELHNYNKPFIIKFKKYKKIKSIEIYNSEYRKHPFPPIDIFTSQDGVKWSSCKYNLYSKNDKFIFLFYPNTCNGNFINLVYKNKAKSYWPISEIIIHAK